MSDYAPEEMGPLLALLHDGGRAWGPVREVFVEPGMPTAAANPAHSGGWMCELADAGVAWERAPLTEVERRRVFMYHVLGWAQHEIAEYEGCIRQAVAKSVESALAKMADYLNNNSNDEETR